MKIWETNLARLCEGKDLVTSREAWDACVTARHSSPTHADIVARIMKQLGFRKRKQRIYKEANPVWVWVRIEYPKDERRQRSGVLNAQPLPEGERLSEMWAVVILRLTDARDEIPAAEVWAALPQYNRFDQRHAQIVKELFRKCGFRRIEFVWIRDV